MFILIESSDCAEFLRLENKTTENQSTSLQFTHTHTIFVGFFLLFLFEFVAVFPFGEKITIFFGFSGASLLLPSRSIGYDGLEEMKIWLMPLIA